MSDSLPLIEELSPAVGTESVFAALSHLPNCLWLDSALPHETLGRYSFLAADPFQWLSVPADGTDGLATLAECLAGFPSEPVAGLPPFQGGAAGLFGYELNQSLERLPRASYDEFQTPAMAVGMYDVVVAIDHVADRVWLISQGFPETNEKARRNRAERRLTQFRQLLSGPIEQSTHRPNIGPSSLNSISKDKLARQFSTRGPDLLTSSFSDLAFCRAVQRAIDYIYAGDVFQVNLAQRLLHPAVDDSISLYLRLRERNPATFAAYFDLGQFQIVSASPERFLQVQEGQVETRPIKGTRERQFETDIDSQAASELLHSEKDRAENVMIVDLLRNDLSKVCQPNSVEVTQLCGLEVYQYVQHLVSAVCGKLESGRTVLDLLRGAFPGGSITGAPKVRAMEIIAELEPTARGPYCGSLGYLGFDGTMDTNILIRTITAGRGWWQLPVGGGIVSQSDPKLENEETWQKAKGMIKALR